LDFTNVGEKDGQIPATGDGYSWSADTCTLTLIGLNFAATEFTARAIILPDGATVVSEEGTINNITLANAPSIGIFSMGTYSIEGNGTLYINADCAMFCVNGYTLQ